MPTPGSHPPNPPARRLIRAFSLVNIALLSGIFAIFYNDPHPLTWFSGFPQWRITVGIAFFTMLAFLMGMWIFWQKHPAAFPVYPQHRWFWAAAALAAVLAALGLSAVLAPSTHPVGLRRMLLLYYPVYAWIAFFGIQIFVLILWQQIKSREKIQQVFPGKPIFLFIGGLLVLTSALILFPTSPIPASRILWDDSSIFRYGGASILQGKLIYVDFWDQKPPLIFYINALGLLIGGNSFIGVWALELIFLALTGWLAFSTLRIYFGRLAAIFTTFCGLINIVFILQRGNLTEQYALLFIWAGLFLYLTPSIRYSRWAGIFSGMAAAAAFLFKQTQIGVWAAILIFEIILWVKDRHTKHLKLITQIAAGFMLVNGLVLFWFGLQGNAFEYWEGAFGYNFSYTGSNLVSRISAVEQTIQNLWGYSPFYRIALLSVLILGMSALLSNLIKKFPSLIPANKEITRLLHFGLFNFFIELILVNTSTRNFPHYYLSIWPALLILSAYLVWTVSLNFLKFGRISQAIVLILICGWFTFAPLNSLLHSLPLSTEYTISKTADFIKENTQKTDRIMTWGSKAQVYTLSGRNAPSRFFFTLPFYTPGPISAKYIDIFLQDLQQHPPELIIDTQDINNPLVQIPEEGLCAYPDTPAQPGLQQVFHWICQNYRPVQTIGKDSWVIYQYKP